MTTQETNPLAYALGACQVESDTYRRERDQAEAHLYRLLLASEDYPDDLDAARAAARRHLERTAR